MFKHLAAALCAAVVVLLAPASALASGVSTSTACTTLGTGTQTFARWFDYAFYTPAPGGSFESGTAPWSLSGAKVVAAQNTYGKGTRALALGANVSAQSPWFCAGREHPTLRFFGRATGLPTGVLNVQVVYRDAAESVRVLDVGAVTAAEVVGWRPAFARALTLAIPLVGDAKTPVAIRLTSVGLLSSWQVDDVQVDPYRSR